MNIANLLFAHFIIQVLLKYSFIETASSLKARWNPVNGKVQSGTSWVFECTLDYNDSVIWYKHVKDITIKLGYNEVIYPNLAGGILKAEKKNEDKIVNTWSLLLVAAELEDSGIFECVSSETPSLNKSATFIICDDPTNPYCDCMVAEGWAAPFCLPQLSEDLTGNYKQVLAGLGITLAVTVVYCIVLGLLYGRDCIYMMHKRRMEKKNKQKNHKKKFVNGPSDAGLYNHEDLSDVTQLAITNESMSENSVSTATEQLSEGKSETSGYSGSNLSSMEHDAKKRKGVTFKSKRSDKTNVQNKSEFIEESRENYTLSQAIQSSNPQKIVENNQNDLNSLEDLTSETMI